MSDDGSDNWEDVDSHTSDYYSTDDEDDDDGENDDGDDENNSLPGTYSVDEPYGSVWFEPRHRLGDPEYVQPRGPAEAAALAAARLMAHDLGPEARELIEHFPAAAQHPAVVGQIRHDELAGFCIDLVIEQGAPRDVLNLYMATLIRSSDGIVSIDHELNTIAGDAERLVAAGADITAAIDDGRPLLFVALHMYGFGTDMTSFITRMVALGARVEPGMEDMTDEPKAREYLRQTEIAGRTNGMKSAGKRA